MSECVCGKQGWFSRWKHPCQPKIERLEETTRRIEVKLSQLTSAIAEANAQLDKAKNEIIAKIAELETALADVDLPPEAEAVLDELRVKAAGLDDIVPDA